MWGWRRAPQRRSANCYMASGPLYGVGSVLWSSITKDNYAGEGLADKRDHQRRELNLLTALRRFLGKDTLPPQIGVTRDISAGGVYLYTRGEIKKGEYVSLIFHLASDWAEGGAPPRLEAEGQVLRVEKNGGVSAVNGGRGVAVKFTEELAVSF